jgi:MFS family permease
MPLKRNFSKWSVLGVLAIALFMINLDVTIVNIALPAIMDDLGASLADIEWVVNIYILVFAISLITLGRLADIFGRQRFFIAGLVIFYIHGISLSFGYIGPRIIEMLIIVKGVSGIGCELP